MKRVFFAGSMCLFGILAAGCATVDVTKTGKGFSSPTRPDDVEILMTRPERHYTELGTVSTTKWNPSETAKMHNALRSKTAPLGAHAVILTASGIVTGPYNTQWMWTTGVAVKYADEDGKQQISQPAQTTRPAP